jgi:hypothetical protein
MGWRERDWAKLREDELEALYSFRRPTPSRTLSTRRVVWTATAALSAAVFGFGWTQREVPPKPPASPPAPSAMFGIAAHESMFGDGVCTELLFIEGRWLCSTIELNNNHVPVIRATPYDGPCSHLKVDGSHWVCLQARPTTQPPPVDSINT